MWSHGKDRALAAAAWALLSVVLALAALACSADPMPTATPAPTITPAAPPATDTPSPTATAPPTPTPMPTRTPTPTFAPTDAPAPTDTPLPDAPLVFIGNAVYVVDLAVSAEEQAQGLSGRLSLDADRAMLFVNDEDAPRTFWMPDMHSPLDMVWIRSNCTVDGVTVDVPNPPVDTPRDLLPRYPSTGPVRFILEINAGQADAHGIVPGAPVQFAGQIENHWGC